MNIDFSIVLLVLVLASGGIWLGDRFWLRRRRLEVSRLQTAGSESVPSEPVAVEYARAFFPVLLLVFLLRSFLAEPFQIPTGSMIPTLEVGDFIVVNKYAYGLRLPVVGTRIVGVARPKRGEVAVFIPPHEDKYYIKRVIGLPGDTVRFENKRLYINGETVPRTLQRRIQIDTAVGLLPGSLHTETVGGVEHITQHIDLVRPDTARTVWVVPPGHYFMMGDNRDNSADSRVWGPVSEDKIIGKAVAVWMHKQPGLSLPTFSRNKRIR